jgi:hypothetical protein
LNLAARQFQFREDKIDFLPVQGHPATVAQTRPLVHGEGAWAQTRRLKHPAFSRAKVHPCSFRKLVCFKRILPALNSFRFFFRWVPASYFPPVNY